MKNILIISLLSILIISCSDYEVRDDGVYFTDWNEGHGTTERLLEEADKNTFKQLSDDKYGKDKNHVFYNGSKIDGAISSSFELLTGGYAIDEVRAYYYGDSIATSNADKFEIIDAYYSKDDKNIYYTTNPLNVCSVDNFEFVYKDNSESDVYRWTTDGCYYYMNNYKIPSEDYQKIKLYKESTGIASDKQYVYYQDRNIYYNEEGERILDTIDINSFKVTEFLSCEDKFGCINVFHGRKNCD